MFSDLYLRNCMRENINNKIMLGDNTVVGNGSESMLLTSTSMLASLERMVPR